jgi:hypothetical protein
MALPTREILRVESSTDHDLLLKCLENENVECFKPKSEVAAIVLALGGGVGIGTMIRSLAPAIKAYFDGKKEVAKAQKRVLVFKYKGKNVEITAENAGVAERELLREFTPHSK